MSSQNAIDRLLHVWVQMNRIDKQNIWKCVSNLTNCCANILETITKTFPAMAGHQDDLVSINCLSQTRRQIGNFPMDSFSHPEQSINYRVACYKNTRA